MRLKDADELLKAIANSGLIWKTNECLDVIEVLAVKKIIDDAPTVDTTFRDVVAYECGQKSVEQRPKGKWIYEYDDFYKCSLCGRGICTNWENDPTKDFPFCHCGADMRGENT